MTPAAVPDGQAAGGSVRLRFQTYEFGEDDIHVRTLRDRQQFADDHHEAADVGISSAAWPLFGTVFPSATILADLMHTFEVEGLRILEVGCGIGLSSLVLAQRNADISATDHNPAAEGFLEFNTELNDQQSIPFLRAGWDEGATDLGRFDLLIGSDVLYDRFCIEPLADFLAAHARPDSQLIVVDPGRGLHGRFARELESRGFVRQEDLVTSADRDSEGFRILSFLGRAAG